MSLYPFVSIPLHCTPGCPVVVLTPVRNVSVINSSPAAPAAAAAAAAITAAHAAVLLLPQRLPLSHTFTCLDGGMSHEGLGLTC